MYKKVLLPTDGSELSAAAAVVGVAFAKSIGAGVVGLYVSPQYQYPVYVEIIPPTYPSEEEYANTMKKAGEMHLKPIEEVAAREGIAFTGVTAFSDVPAQQIVDTALQTGCDLIFMGSHGRTGLNKLLIGSVTAKVLGLSRLPVLVHRLDLPVAAKGAKSEPAAF